jgi:hypothetical protein
MEELSQWLIPIITALFGASLTYLFGLAKAKRLRAEKENERRRGFYQQMKLHLDASSNAINNQYFARDRLFELLKKTHGPLPPLEYEELFRKFYPELNEDEKVLFELIRGITQTALQKHNEEMLKLIESHPTYYSELPKLKVLHDHLDLWMSKFNSLFVGREDTCLVYVGVEEKKPFPAGIEKEIDQKLLLLPAENVG